MSEFTKADGARILINFDEDLIGDVTGQESFFTVTVQEYDYVPNGTLYPVVKAVLSTEPGETAKQLILNMSSLERFESAVGSIKVEYSGGALSGVGGPVENFSKTFEPTDLIAKPDQNDQEHISMSVSPFATLIKVDYHYAKEEEHIGLTAVPKGTLTHINDL